jgi:hypothetical protein
MKNNFKTQGDGEGAESADEMAFDRAECPECNGTGNVTLLIGDEACGGRCPSCLGKGVQLTREDFLKVAAKTDTPQCDECDWELVRVGSKFYCQQTACGRFGLPVNSLGNTPDEQIDANEAWEIKRAS